MFKLFLHASSCVPCGLREQLMSDVPEGKTLRKVDSLENAKRFVVGILSSDPMVAFNASFVLFAPACIRCAC